MVSDDSGNPIPMILAVNKFDLVMGKHQEQLEEYQTQKYLEDFAEQHGFIGVLRVSAKEDIDISAIFSSLTREILIKEINEMSQNTEYDPNDKSRSSSVFLNKSTHNAKM